MTRLAPIALALGLLGCQPSEFGIVPRPVETFAPAPPDHGSWLSMDLAPDNERIVIAYYDREFEGLGFATGMVDAEGAVNWLHERVDGYSDPESGLPTGNRGKYASMKVAPDGSVWIAYQDVVRGQLRFAHRVGGPNTWITDQIEGPDASVLGTPKGNGHWASLAINGEGKPVVAYHDADLGVLKRAVLASIDTAEDGSASYAWDTQVVQTGEGFNGLNDAGDPVTRDANVGQYARLMIRDGVEYIAYYDAGQRRLGLLEGSAGNYTQQFITPEGVNMGQWPSMMIAEGTLHIAFHDVQNQNLMVASRGAGGWRLEVADSADFVGADTEIVRRGGTIGVVYFDGQYNNMKYAEKSGEAWTSRTLASEGAVGFHNEVIRRGEDFWAASYDFVSRQVFITKIED